MSSDVTWGSLTEDSPTPKPGTHVLTMTGKHGVVLRLSPHAPNGHHEPEKRVAVQLQPFVAGGRWLPSIDVIYHQDDLTIIK